MKISYKAVATFLIATPLFALALRQTNSPFNSFVNKLHDAGSVTVSAKSVSLGSSASAWNLVLSKPNMFKLDDATTTVVADGTTVTTYQKDKNQYYQVPETATSVKDALTKSQYSIWLAFFDANAFGTPIQSQSMGTQAIDGSNFDKVQVKAPAGNHTNATLYLDQSSSMPSKAQFLKGTDSSSAQITKFNKVTLGDKLTAADFSFTPPADAKKVDPADLTSAEWLTDLEKAKTLAAQTHRFVFVDFFATWCGPCKMLQSQVLDTDKFKALSKYFVFCRIDTDQQPTVAAHYNITALPTQDVLDSNGNVLDQTVGYANPDAFYQFISKWEKSAP